MPKNTPSAQQETPLFDRIPALAKAALDAGLVGQAGAFADKDAEKSARRALELAGVDAWKVSDVLDAVRIFIAANLPDGLDGRRLGELATRVALKIGTLPVAAIRSGDRLGADAISALKERSQAVLAGAGSAQELVDVAAEASEKDAQRAIKALRQRAAAGNEREALEIFRAASKRAALKQAPRWWLQDLRARRKAGTLEEIPTYQLPLEFSQEFVLDALGAPDSPFTLKETVNVAIAPYTGGSPDATASWLWESRIDGLARLAADPVRGVPFVGEACYALTHNWPYWGHRHVRKAVRRVAEAGLAAGASFRDVRFDKVQDESNDDFQAAGLAYLETGVEKLPLANLVEACTVVANTLRTGAGRRFERQAGNVADVTRSSTDYRPREEEENPETEWTKRRSALWEAAGKRIADEVARRCDAGLDEAGFKELFSTVFRKAAFEGAHQSFNEALNALEAQLPPDAVLRVYAVIGGIDNRRDFENNVINYLGRTAHKAYEEAAELPAEKRLDGLAQAAEKLMNALKESGITSGLPTFAAEIEKLLSPEGLRDEAVENLFRAIREFPRFSRQWADALAAHPTLNFRDHGDLLKKMAPMADNRRPEVHFQAFQNSNATDPDFAVRHFLFAAYGWREDENQHAAYLLQNWFDENDGSTDFAACDAPLDDAPVGRAVRAEFNKRYFRSEVARALAAEGAQDAQAETWPRAAGPAPRETRPSEEDGAPF